jgi:hypothetical protein
MRRPAIMIPLLYSGIGKGTSESSKVGGGGGMGGKLYSLASLSIDEGLAGDDESSLSVSLFG